MMAPRTFPTQFPKGMLDAQCPCGGTRKLRLCCHSPLDGHIRPPMPNLAPPSPVTGYAHPKCYISFTRDCCGSISGEHYVSRSVLDAMGKDIIVSGMPWQRDGESATYGKGSMTANVLCRKHNSVLSPIDIAAERFFSSMNFFAAQLNKKTWSKRISIRVIRGELLELWALKTLLGIFHAGIARSDGVRLKDGFSLRPESFGAPLAGTPVKHPLGMYVRSALNHRFQIENSVAMAPLTSNPGSDVIGLWIKMAGQDIKFFFEKATVDFAGIEREHTYRPTDLNFVSAEPVDERLFVFKLAWGSALPKPITFTQEIAAQSAIPQ